MIDKSKVTAVNIETDLVDVALERTRITWVRRQDSTTEVLEPGPSMFSHEPPFRCQSVTNLSSNLKINHGNISLDIALNTLVEN